MESRELYSTLPMGSREKRVVALAKLRRRCRITRYGFLNFWDFVLLLIISGMVAIKSGESSSAQAPFDEEGVVDASSIRLWLERDGF